MKAIAALWQVAVIAGIFGVGGAVYTHGAEGGRDIGLFVRNVVEGYRGATPVCPISSALQNAH
jgi:hypothetical protein